jgi:anti-sigma-K factor RskA
MSAGSNPFWVADPQGAAGEYVLGTLSSEERAAFEQALVDDPGLRAAVKAWEARLEPLTNEMSSVEPDPRTWDAIRARLAERPNAAMRTIADPRIVNLERGLRRWRLAAAGATALAASLALYVAVSAPWRAAGPQYVAVVNRGGEVPALVVRVDTGAGIVQVRSLAAETPPDRSLELWYIGAGATPHSLGVIADPSARFAVPAALRNGSDGGSLAVSVEPKGGSPSGAPTGPVVYSGRLIRE